MEELALGNELESNILHGKVKTVIIQLKIKKSPEHDGITNEHIKMGRMVS